jgi:hypothetical protein
MESVYPARVGTSHGQIAHRALELRELVGSPLPSPARCRARVLLADAGFLQHVVRAVRCRGRQGGAMTGHTDTDAVL